MADISNITVSVEGVDTVCEIKDKVARNDIALNRTTLGTQCKNLLNETEYLSSITSISKGTMSISGNSITLTATANDCYTSPFANYDKGYKIPVTPNTSYILSWESNNNNSGNVFAFRNGSTSDGIGADNKHEGFKYLKFTTNSDTTFITIRFGVTTSGDSITYSNIMLRYADILDDTYEPYSDNVDTRLTENKSNTAINKSTLGYQCKNLLKNNAATKTVNGITFTVNDDKSVTLNGTSTAQADFYLRGAWGSTSEILQKNKYIASIGVSQSSTFNGVVMHCINNTTSIGSPSCNYPSLAVNSAITAVYISVSKGYTFSNYKLYPMIRYADITDSTYEPYQPSVQEQINALEARIAALGG